MRSMYSLLIMVLMITACSTPKQAYYFDHYNYYAGKKSIDPAPIVASPELTAPSADLLVADASGKIILNETPPNNITAAEAKVVEARLKNMTKEDRHEVKSAIKQKMRELKSNPAAFGLAPAHAKEMDKDLKLAIIFGAVGLTLSLFSGVNAAFGILGVIAIVVGVVFLVRWLLRQ